MLKTRIAVFVSGGGTNLQALLDAQAAEKSKWRDRPCRGEQP